MVILTIQHGRWKINQKIMKERRNLTSGWIFEGYFEISVNSTCVTPLHLCSILKGIVIQLFWLCLFHQLGCPCNLVHQCACRYMRMCVVCACVHAIQWDRCLFSSSFYLYICSFLLLPCIYYHTIVLRSRALQFSFSFHFFTVSFSVTLYDVSSFLFPLLFVLVPS